jgi:hypothetical protein
MSAQDFNDIHPNIRKRKNAEMPLFLSKTYAMLQECPTQLAAWNQEGTSFIVFDAKELSEKIIPQFFKHSNFSSFVRQLNFYGFQKVKSNHSHFLAKVGRSRPLSSRLSPLSSINLRKKS